MNDAFQVNVNNKAAPEGDCATDHLAVGPYTIDGAPAGGVLCYTVERGSFSFTRCLPQSHIEWTDENASIYAQAIRNDLGRPQPVRVVADVVRSASSRARTPCRSRTPVVARSRRTAAGRHVHDEPTEEGAPGSADRPVPCTSTGGRTQRRDRAGTGLERDGRPALAEAEHGHLLAEAGLLLRPHRRGQHRARRVHVGGTGHDADVRERTEGGTCAGPHKMSRPGDAWTRAPDGDDRRRAGRVDRARGSGGGFVGSTHAPPTPSPNSWPGLVPGRFQDRLRRRRRRRVSTCT